MFEKLIFGVVNFLAPSFSIGSSSVLAEEYLGRRVEKHSISHGFKFTSILTQTVELAALECLNKIPIELKLENVFATQVV